MIPRPYIKNHPIKYFNNTVNLRLKFNEVLIEGAAGRKNHLHLEHPHEFFNDFQDYDHIGKLSDFGKLHYWRFINTELKRYEKGEVDLLPKQNTKKRKS